MPDPARPDWAAIRHAYEHTDAALADICETGGITPAALHARRKKEAWKRLKPRGFAPGKRPPPDPAAAPAPAARSKRPAQRATAEGGAAPAPSPSRGGAGGRRNGTAKPDDRAPSNPAPRSSSRARPTLAATPAHRRRLIARLVAAISLKLEQLERRMNTDLARPDPGEAATATDHERETRAIGALIDNLGKLTEMQTELDRPAAKPGTTADTAGEAERIRRELAERLAKLVGAAAARA